jgi:hypothetical protein
MAALLNALGHRRLHSAASSKYLIEIMKQTITFPDRLKAGLACIDHKFLVRLAPDQKLVIDSGSGSRTDRLRRSILLRFLRIRLKTVCTRTAALNLPVEWTRKCLFKSTLTRIERVDFPKRVIYAG